MRYEILACNSVARTRAFIRNLFDAKFTRAAHKQRYVLFARAFTRGTRAKLVTSLLLLDLIRLAPRCCHGDSPVGIQLRVINRRNRRRETRVHLSRVSQHAGPCYRANAGLRCTRALAIVIRTGTRQL